MRRPFAPFVLLVLCAPHALAQTAATFGSYKGAQPRYAGVELHSLYVPMRDGVRIAIDVVLPKGLAAGTKLPTIFDVTRYWRASEGDGPSDLERFFAAQGYAFVAMDVRGTGASTGVWP